MLIAYPYVLFVLNPRTGYLVSGLVAYGVMFEANLVKPKTRGSRYPERGSRYNFEFIRDNVEGFSIVDSSTIRKL